MLNSTEIVGRIIVLKREDPYVFVCQGFSVPAAAVIGLPKSKYTQTRVKEYDREVGRLLLILERGPEMNQTHFEMNSETNEQAFKHVTIKAIVVDSALQSFYSTPPIYTKSEAKPILSKSEAKAMPIRPEQSYQPPTPTITIETVKYPVARLDFHDGFLTAQVSIPQFGINKPLQIVHAFSKKRFDPIKRYFARRFEEGKIELRVTISHIGRYVTDVLVESADVLKINDGLLDSVRDDLFEDFLTGQEDRVVSVTDLADQLLLGDNPEPENTILNRLLTEEKAKHYHHLSFLAKHHSLGFGNLKVTAKPFSFIFAIEKQSSYYIVWETYESKEATYMWRFVKDQTPFFEQEFLKIENQIKALRRKQKRAYRKEHKNNENFQVIEHDYSLPAHGFEKWQMAYNQFAK